MSPTRRLLKSSQSLYSTSTHPTMVTHRLRSWSWMIDLHPFRFMSISIPQIRLFQTLTLKLNYKVKVMGVVKGQEHTVSPVSNWFAFFLFHINQVTIPEQGWGQVKYLYLMQNLEYLVLTCTWHFEIQKYLVLTCTWRQSTWYLSKYFQVLLSINKYSGWNLQIGLLQQVTTKHHNHKLLCVFTAWGLWTSRIGLPPLRCSCNLRL